MVLDLTTLLSLFTSTSLKTNLKSRLSKVDRSKITIDYPLNEIIIGLILGFGLIQKRVNSRFIYAQSSLRSHHLIYFKYILEIFKPSLYKDFKLKERRIFKDKRSNTTYSSVSFATLTLPCFNEYKKLFYDSNNK